jgi:hypothetical protein
MTNPLHHNEQNTCHIANIHPLPATCQIYPHPMPVKYSNNCGAFRGFFETCAFSGQNKDDPFVENGFRKLRDGGRDAFFRFIFIST